MDVQVLEVAWDVAAGTVPLMNAVTSIKKRLGYPGTVPTSMTHEEGQGPVEAEQLGKTFRVEITVLCLKDSVCWVTPVFSCRCCLCCFIL